MAEYPGLLRVEILNSQKATVAAAVAAAAAGTAAAADTAATAAGAITTTDGASTASTVAIDNKIEQAMDLVKSHLMFAVREEVEVLKEKITELMERISQLEYENTVLRQYATQEALQQIQQPHSNT